MHYLVTVGYELEQQDREGNPRLQKINYVVEAASTEEVTIVMSKYRGESTMSSKTMSIKEMNIECVIDPSLTPQYYK
jgi:hypothetical protein